MWKEKQTNGKCFDGGNVSLTIAYGKSLEYDDPIGLDSKISYSDQKGNKGKISMGKFVELAKKEIC